jgi:hypothetical protein
MDVLIDVGGELPAGCRLVELVAVPNPDRIDLEPVARRDGLAQPLKKSPLGIAVSLV